MLRKELNCRVEGRGSDRIIFTFRKAPSGLFRPLKISRVKVLRSKRAGVIFIVLAFSVITNIY